MLEKDQFVKLCYNLNPDCADAITDRACLSELLNEDGMLDSVLDSIKVIPEDYFVEKEEKSRFEVMNHGKAAFLTAISSGYGHLTVEKIEKALSVNQDLIENIFEADQLVTTRLEESSSIWDNSCVKIRKGDLLTYENREEDFSIPSGGVHDGSDVCLRQQSQDAGGHSKCRNAAHGNQRGV